MNRILNFISNIKNKLPDVTERNNIEDGIYNTSVLLKEMAVPTVSDVSQFFYAKEPSSVYGRELIKLIGFAVRLKQPSHWKDVLSESLQVVDKHLNIIEAEVKRNFVAKLVTSSINVRQVAILDYINMLYCYVNAVCKVCYVVILEEAAVRGDMRYAPSRGVAEVNHTALEDLVTSLGIIMGHKDDLTAAIRAVSPADADEEALDGVASQFTTNQLTLTQGLFPGRGNIYYNIRKWFIEYQNDVYECRKEERRALQITMQQTLEYLDERENLSEGERAKAQRWVESCRGRVEKLDAKIMKYEEDAYS